MSIVGFLRLQSLRYKNKRENRNLIAKIWQSYDKKMFFACWIYSWCTLLVTFDTRSSKKQQTIGSFTFCGQRNLNQNLQQNVKVAIDCNQQPQWHIKVGIDRNQCPNEYQK